MVSVTISAAGKPPALARKLPITVVLGEKTLDSATVEDVKQAIAAQFPKVRLSFLSTFFHHIMLIGLKYLIVLSIASKTDFERGKEGPCR